MTTYEYRQMRNNGHKAEYGNRGPNDAYWIVHCECGWSKGGFIQYKRDAKSAHDRHLCNEINKCQTTPNR